MTNQLDTKQPKVEAIEKVNGPFDLEVVTVIAGTLEVLINAVRTSFPVRGDALILRTSALDVVLFETVRVNSLIYGNKEKE